MKIMILNSNKYTNRDIELFSQAVDDGRKIVSKQTAIAHYHVKKHISEQINKSISEIKFTKNPHGKPLCSYGIYFSISHSDEYIAIVFDNSEIGIDIEKKRKINQKLWKKTASESDIAQYLLDDADTGFLKMWTIKEAYFKFIGTGITDPKKVSVSDITKSCNIYTDVTDEYVLSIVKIAEI